MCEMDEAKLAEFKMFRSPPLDSVETGLDQAAYIAESDSGSFLILFLPGARHLSDS